LKEIPLSLKDKIIQANNTLYNNMPIQVLINITNAPTNIWYIETVRRKTGLGDMAFALKRTNTDMGATDAYEIHNDNGIIKTATKSLINFTKAKWQDAFTVGTGQCVAIEFDGHWLMDSNQRYNLVTEDVPYIFWTDSNNILWCQKWNDDTTKLQLATDVVDVSAIRGWKNIYVSSDDQGLIVAYIKIDGQVYYRNYCLQPLEQPAIWETEKAIAEIPIPAENISLFRTNDYRTGFIASSNGQIYWVLTDRNWARMAVPTESITASAMEPEIELIEIEYINAYEPAEYIDVAPGSIEVELGYALTDNKFVEIYNEPTVIDGVEDWGKILIIRTEHDLHNLSVSDFEITDAYNRTYYPTTIEQIGDRTYKLSYLDLNNFNNVDKVGTMRFKGLVTTNAVDLIYLPFEMVFHPQNLVPTFIPLPEVGAIWNE
jgi:hypothetical protein